MTPEKRHTLYDYSGIRASTGVLKLVGMMLAGRQQGEAIDAQAEEVKGSLDNRLIDPGKISQLSGHQVDEVRRFVREKLHPTASSALNKAGDVFGVEMPALEMELEVAEPESEGLDVGDVDITTMIFRIKLEGEAQVIREIRSEDSRVAERMAELANGFADIIRSIIRTSNTSIRQQLIEELGLEEEGLSDDPGGEEIGLGSLGRRKKIILTGGATDNEVKYLTFKTIQTMESIISKLIKFTPTKLIRRFLEKLLRKRLEEEDELGDQL